MVTNMAMNMATVMAISPKQSSSAPPESSAAGAVARPEETSAGTKTAPVAMAGELRLVLLKLIADQPGHGYQLIKAIEELTQGAYAPSPGVVYPTLSLLADEGAVQEIEGEGSRKAFAITEQGQAELTEKAAEVERIVARLTERAEGHRRGPPPQIARALGNLMMVLRQGKHDTAGEEHSVERHNAIVDILDDAAKRIERL
jgi:DNA-binding PadR family transcriptional regulator